MTNEERARAWLDRYDVQNEWEQQADPGLAQMLTALLDTVQAEGASQGRAEEREACAVRLEQRSAELRKKAETHGEGCYGTRMHVIEQAVEMAAAAKVVRERGNP